MTPLADLFLAVNAAGVRFVNLNGQLQLRGPFGSISLNIKAGAAEHQAAILAMLASPTVDTDAREQAEERDAIDWEGALTHEAGGAVLTAALTAWDAIVQRDNAQDWRLEWQMEVGLLYLRMRECKDEVVVAKLKPLANASPRNVADWLALGLRIRETEIELRQAGKLPRPHWPPNRSEG